MNIIIYFNICEAPPVFGNLPAVPWDKWCRQPAGPAPKLGGAGGAVWRYLSLPPAVSIAEHPCSSKTCPWAALPTHAHQELAPASLHLQA